MLKDLETYLKKLAPEGIALAFSGGTDSALLLAVLSRICQQNPFPLKALTMRSALQNSDEADEAVRLAKDFNVCHKVFSFNPFSLPEVRHNRTDRCYHCKKAIFTQFAAYARKNNLKFLLDGTNADDLKVYRPGRKALQELGVVSPLAELGINKRQIRELSAELGLKTAFKPAAPCLATRFEYNTLLDDASLQRAAEGEKIIKNAFPALGDIRLRVHGNLARLEVPKDSLSAVAADSAAVVEKLKRLGFDFVTLDLEGFRSGSFDIFRKQV